MTGWLTRAADLVGNNETLVLVTICCVEGSAPREPGAKIIVTRDAQWGTIGGGALEFAAIAQARRQLKNKTLLPVFEDFPLGPALGQCCGGRVRVSYEMLGPQDLIWLKRAEAFVAQGETILLERKIVDPTKTDQGWRIVRGDDARQSHQLVLLDPNGTSLSQAMPPEDECASIRERVCDARARVFIFGAGHVGTAIAKLLQTMPTVVTWIDRRENALPPQLGDHFTLLHTDDEIGVARRAPAGMCAFVLTHDHQLDYTLTQAILQRGNSAYCGLIGSKTKRARFENRMRRAGLDDASLARLSCPIGGSSLKSKAPAMIALAAVYEMFIAHQAFAKDHQNWN